MLTGSVFIVALQRVAQTIPDGIIRRHLRQRFEFIHDGIYHFFERLFEISILLFTTDHAQLQCQLQQLLLDGCRRFGDGFHSVDKSVHGCPRRFGHFFVRHVLLNIDFFQFVCINRICQNRLHIIFFAAWIFFAIEVMHDIIHCLAHGRVLRDRAEPETGCRSVWQFFTETVQERFGICELLRITVDKADTSHNLRVSRCLRHLHPPVHTAPALRHLPDARRWQEHRSRR